MTTTITAYMGVSQNTGRPSYHPILIFSSSKPAITVGFLFSRNHHIVIHGENYTGRKSPEKAKLRLGLSSMAVSTSFRICIRTWDGPSCVGWVANDGMSGICFGTLNEAAVTVPLDVKYGSKASLFEAKTKINHNSKQFADSMIMLITKSSINKNTL